MTNLITNRLAQQNICVIIFAYNIQLFLENARTMARKKTGRDNIQGAHRMITYSVDINAPIETAFRMVDDDEKIKEWGQGIESIEYPDGQDRDNPVGTRFIQKIREGGRVADYEGEVTAYQPPHHLGVTFGSKQFTMQVDYRFTETPTGTRLDYTGEIIRTTLVGRIMMVLFGWLTQRILKKQMAALKALAESEAHHAG
jgi:uncharacterized protein YndB with AHSA1/START domain